MEAWKVVANYSERWGHIFTKVTLEKEKGEENDWDHLNLGIQEYSEFYKQSNGVKYILATGNNGTQLNGPVNPQHTITIAPYQPKSPLV